jgi:hypothetical protein
MYTMKVQLTIEENWVNRFKLQLEKLFLNYIVIFYTQLISVLKKLIIFDFFNCCLKRNVLNKLSVLQFVKVEQSMWNVVFARKC